MLGNLGSRVASLVFSGLSQLLDLAEQIGSTRDRLFGAARDVRQRVQAVDLRSVGGEADSTAELHLQIP